MFPSECELCCAAPDGHQRIQLPDPFSTLPDHISPHLKNSDLTRNIITAELPNHFESLPVPVTYNPNHH
jgi:hypothetical protein